VLSNTNMVLGNKNNGLKLLNKIQNGLATKSTN